MAKNRFISFMIVIVAAVFIVYVVIDSLAGKEDDRLSFTNTGEQNEASNNNNNGTSEVPFETSDEVGLQRGMFAPDFTLPLWGNEEGASLSDYRGQIVVLNLWASWCPPCRREMPDLIQFHENYQDKGVQVLGINLATLERSADGAAEFMEEYQVTFPTFVDQPIDDVNRRGIVASLYMVDSIPHTYILDEDGRIFIAIRGEIKYEMLEDLVNKVNE